MKHLIGAIFFLLPTWIRGQAVSQTPASTAGSNSPVDSFWSMTQLAGNIGYIIMGVLAVGLFLIVYQLINLILDSRASRKLLKTQLTGRSLPEIEQILTAGGNSMLKEMGLRLLTFYQSVGNALNIQEEIASFVNQKNESFEVFQSRVNFLSDSAGALGLLGTVWGVFLTFFGGNLDSEKILSGMGVALITTLLGLVVSLILNFLGTEINSYYHKKMEALLLKGDELRLSLLNQMPRSAAITAESSVAEGVRSVDFKENLVAAGPQKPTQPQLRIKKLAEGGLVVGERLPGALVIQVTDSAGKPFPGAPIIATADDYVSFAGGKKEQTVMADSQGLASFDLHAGNKAGKGKIRFRMEENPDTEQEVEIPILPADPAKIQILSGNDQAVPVHQELPEKLKVRVEDAFGNTISGTQVVFQLKMGKGTFKDGNHVYVTTTDSEGVAESSFILGEETGFYLIEVRVKDGNNCPPAEFRILGKNHA